MNWPPAGLTKTGMGFNINSLLSEKVKLCPHPPPIPPPPLFLVAYHRAAAAPARLVPRNQPLLREENMDKPLPQC